MIKRKYTYYVTFLNKGDNELSFGYGYSIIVRDKKINSVEQIKSVLNFIEKENNLDNVIILDYKRVKK